MGIPLAGAANSAKWSYGDQRRPLLCFTDPDPEDIVTKGVKIVGSAQRRRRGAVLQHGSFLLARSSRTPELLGVSDVAGESSGASMIGRIGCVKRIVDALGLESRPVDIPAKAAALAAELEMSRYRNSALDRSSLVIRHPSLVVILTIIQRGNRGVGASWLRDASVYLVFHEELVLQGGVGILELRKIKLQYRGAHVVEKGRAPISSCRSHFNIITFVP